MREIGLIARYEYVRHIRRRSFLWTALLLPLFVAVLGGLAILLITSSHSEDTIGFVDQSGRFAQARLDRIDDDPVEIPVRRFPDEAAAQAALKNNQITSYVVVPADYLKNGKVDVHGPRALGDTARTEIRDLLQQGLVAQLDPALQERFSEPIKLTLRTAGSDRDIDASNVLLFLLPYLLGILFIITTFTTSGFLLQALADEKEDRVIEILATSLSPSQMMAGKVIGLSGVGLTQITAWLAWVAVALATFKPVRDQLQNLDLPWLALVLALIFFVLGYLLIAGLYATIGAAVATPQEAQQFAAPISLVATAPFLLVLAILAQPNSTLSVVLSMIPLTAPLTMLFRLPLATIPFWQIALSLLLLIASVIGTMLLSARVMRLGMLRTGKGLSLREMLGPEARR